MADQLSIEHIRQSLISLNEIRDARIPSNPARDESSQGIVGGHVINFEEKHAQALIALALKVKTRKH